MSVVAWRSCLRVGNSRGFRCDRFPLKSTVEWKLSTMESVVICDDDDDEKKYGSL